MGDIVDDPPRSEGQVPHDDAAILNPVRVAGKANSDEPAEVDNGDQVDAWADLLGRFVVVQNHPSPESPAHLSVTSSSEEELIAAPGAGLSIYVTLVTASNTSNKNVSFDIKEGSTVKFTYILPKTGGGFVLPLPGIGWKLPANTALNVQSDTGVTSIEVTALYYIAP